MASSGRAAGPAPAAPGGYGGLEGPAPAPRNRRPGGPGRKALLVVALCVVAAVWLGGIGLTTAQLVGTVTRGQGIDGQGELNAFALRPGDCLAGVDGPPYQGVSCSVPHGAQVVASVDAGRGRAPGAFDDAALKDQAIQMCRSLVPVRLRASAEEMDRLSLFFLYPSPETWRSGDRRVTCLITSDTPLTRNLLEDPHA